MIAAVANFFEATWFVWWFVALVVIVRWCWSTYIQDDHGDQGSPEPWRNLYQIAINERDDSKIALRIEAAEAAILLEFGAQLFSEDTSERVALQIARDNLRRLRESYPQNSDKRQAA